MVLGTFGLVSQTSMNFSVGDGFKVFVGDLDITNAVQGLNLKRPMAEIMTPQSWTGSLTLSTLLDPTLIIESLDDLLNPPRWARGQFPVTVTLRNSLFATLRIMEYFYDEDLMTGEAELGDILTLVDFRSPAEDYSQNFKPCAPVSIQEIVETGLKAAGITNYQIQVQGSVPVPPDKPSGSWIQWIQSYLGERGFWLYVDPNEVVRVEKYPTTYSPILRRTRLLVENYKRERSPDYPPEKLTITATGQKFNSCDGEPEGIPDISEEFGSLPSEDGDGGGSGNVLLSRTTTVLVKKPIFGQTQSGSDGKAEVRSTKVEQALGAVFPKTEEGNTSLVTTVLTVTKKRYNDKRFLEAEEIIVDKLLGLCLPEAFEGDKQLIPGAEKTLITYSEMIPGISVQSGLGEGIAAVRPGMMGSGILVYKKTDYSTLFASGTKATKLEGGGSKPNQIRWNRNTNTLTTEEWRTPSGTISAIGSGVEADECPCNEARYVKKVSKRTQVVSSAQSVKVQGKAYTEDENYFSFSGLVSSSRDSGSQNNTTFPNWDKIDSECPVCQIALKETTGFAQVSFTTFRERESVISADTLNTSAECQSLAKLMGGLAHQRYHQRLITMPMATEYLTSNKPFTVADVHNGRFVLDAPSLVVTENEMSISWTGNYVGSIAPVEPNKRLPIWIPTTGATGGTLTSMNYPEPVVIPQGQYFTLPVLGAGGTFPYSYVFTGLPVGMGVSGQVVNINPTTSYPPIITGVPTTPGDYVVSVQVTDFCGVVSTSFLTITVAPPASAVSTLTNRNEVTQLILDMTTLTPLPESSVITNPLVLNVIFASDFSVGNPSVVLNVVEAGVRLSSRNLVALNNVTTSAILSPLLAVNSVSSN